MGPGFESLKVHHKQNDVLSRVRLTLNFAYGECCIESRVRIPEGAPAAVPHPIVLLNQVEQRVSVSNAKGPPVPIPNTEVKLCSAENTCLETDRKNRSTLTLFQAKA